LRRALGAVTRLPGTTGDPRRNRGDGSFASQASTMTRSSSDTDRLLLDANNAAVLAHKLALIKIEADHRLAWYRSHFDPDQPRVPAGHSDGGQWTRAGGYEGSVEAARTRPTQSPSESVTDEQPDPIRPGARYAQAKTQIVIGPRALTGIARIDEITKALAETLARAVDTVEYLPTLTPRLYGTLVHLAFANMVRFQRLPGIGFWDVETTFSLEPGAHYGSKDSIRTDVVLRNEVGDIIAIYDVKTGNQGLRPGRVNELRANAQVSPSVPVIELHVLHGVRLTREQIGPSLGTRQAWLLPQINVSGV